MLKRRNTFAILFFLICPLYLYAQASGERVLKDGLILTLWPDGNNIISPDKVVALIETGEWKSPTENEQVTANGKVVGMWRRISADDKGWFKDSTLRNAYVYVHYDSPKEEIVLLEAAGNEMTYVNGSPRTGNPYGDKDGYEEWETKFDFCLLPIKLKEGKNDFLFKCDRGLLKARIHSTQRELILNEKDVTLPDVLLNHAADTFGAIPIINTTERSYKDLFIKTWSDASIPVYHPVNKINPLSIYKAPFRIVLPKAENAAHVKLHLELVEKRGESKEDVLSSTVIELKVVKEGVAYKETFISTMDGSVQYYGTKPPVNLESKPALFLSLHGAGVEAINQANSYGRKNWGYVVAPTNRRPYGYHWENWGRLDALEVLSIAKRKFDIDESHVYLTGHSMGGHGTWSLGINYPDQFAALGPSAGWISIWSYRLRPYQPTTNVGTMLMRSAKQSDTYALSPNLKQNGLYIIHGSADDNVRPEQSRSMIDTLSAFHKDYVYHEEPGAGHWWDNSGEDGADCVDWMPMFDFFAHRSIPGKDRIKMIDFVTANPAIASKNYWVQIINQVEQQKLSRITIRLESGRGAFVGVTKNIEMLAIDASVLSNDKPVSIELDGQLISVSPLPADRVFYLRKEKNKWALAGKFNTENKNPARCGNLREALNYHVVFVYGTHGNEEENKWAYAKARYDAEQIWYRGNGSVEIIQDVEFDLVKYKDRSVILFGNSRTNSAWNVLLKDSPVQVDHNKITVGNKEYKGNDLSCLMIRPRKDSERASIGVVSGTGIKGMKLTNLALYHQSYVSFPDVVLYDSDILKSDEQGVKFTGYFGNDWSLEKGEFVVR